MSDADLATLLAFFKAMANESRLRIVGLLAERERSVQELAELLELKEPTVSHHLTALKALGLVSARSEGVTHWHALKLETLTALNRGLLDRAGGVAVSREAEVNELIQRRHWDCATLRRELIGYGMMGREGGVYWRCPEGQWRTSPD